MSFICYLLRDANTEPECLIGSCILAKPYGIHQSRELRNEGELQNSLGGLVHPEAIGPILRVPGSVSVERGLRLSITYILLRPY